MNHYTQLSEKERHEIYNLLEMKVSKTSIAKRLKRHRSTIYREIDRNQEDGTYLPGLADKQAEKRKHQEKVCKLEKDPALYDYVIKHLKANWSPEQIAGRMRFKKKNYYLCKESIYQYIYQRQDQELYQHLRYKKAKRGLNFGRKARACRYGAIRLITNRPERIENRKTFGHWEGDSILFGSCRKQSIVTLLERKSRTLILLKNEATNSHTVMGNIKSAFQDLPKKARLTMTFDQGAEFANYSQLERALACRVYYCQARSPWQKGSNENMNGRLRPYLPRDANIASIDQDDLNELAHHMNNTPRKCLGFKTPREVYVQNCKDFHLLNA